VVGVFLLDTNLRYQARPIASGGWLGRILPDSALRSLVVEGVWAGVGSVLVFLPQILMLFLFIGVLEDSGYLARAALITDRTMAKAGLQGKSFIPLLSAYACAVPALPMTPPASSRISPSVATAPLRRLG